ncbi:MAG: insulinase family protein [Myxococcales bacterium]|nr:insulinase family protein [Myxococcales bacterium]MCB9530952.1 insulinase family protein [Myxococcales bacterium]MCB9532871.1 insulinase family protein [Myxococcales bacterium]
MKTRRGVALALCGALLGCGGASAVVEPGVVAQATDRSGPGLGRGVETYEVDGVPVIHKQTPGSAIVEVRLVFGRSQHDVGTPPGAARLALDVATWGGGVGGSRAEFAAGLEAHGATLGSSVGYDYAVISASCIEGFVDETWASLAAAVSDPAFRDGDFSLRREQAVAGLRAELDDPDDAVGVLAKQAAFGGHPYSDRPQGDLDSVEQLDLAALRVAYDELVTRDAATVVVVGNVERARVEALVRAALGGRPATGPARAAVPPFRFGEGRVVTEVRPGLPTHYVLGYFAAPPVDSEDYAALQIGLAVLSDRLFEEVRTKRNLSYAVASGLSLRRAPTGYLYVTAVDVDTTLGVMADTVHGLISPGVTEGDLRDQIEGYLTGFYQGLETAGAQATMLADWQLIGGDYADADALVERMRAVTPDDVARVIDAYVRDIQFVIVGDPDGIDLERIEGGLFEFDGGLGTPAPAAAAGPTP